MISAIALLLLGTIAGVAVLSMLLTLSEGRKSGQGHRAERASIAALKTGLMEVSGHVHCLGPPPTSPMTGRPCVQYTLQIETRDDLDPDWARAIEFSESTPFALRDATGELNIENRVWLTNADRRIVETVGALPPAVAEELAVRYGENACGPASEYRLTETRLCEADSLCLVIRVQSLAPLSFDVIRVSPEPSILGGLLPDLSLVGPAIVAALAVLAIIVIVM